MICMSLAKGAARRYLETIKEHAAKSAKVHLAARLAVCAVVIIAATLMFAPSIAQAQFLGQDFVTGNADLASAAGGSIAVGTLSTASGLGSIAVGQLSTASGLGSAAVGNIATASGLSSAAVGNNAVASGAFSAALGNAAFATGTNSTATGYAANASGTNSAAFGSFANAAVSNSTAAGAFSTASGTNSAAFGNAATASGSSSTAVGQSSTASGSGSTAVGQGATAAFSNSAAFGNGAAATAANQQMFGTSTNTYTTPGITSAASKAAQTGPIQLVTSDAGGDLATSSLSGLGIASSADISALNSSINNVANRAYSGVAMAFAMAGVPTVLPGETFVTTMNYGTFEGASAMSFNGAMRVTDHIQFDAGIGYAPDQGIVGGRAGVRIGW